MAVNNSRGLNAYSQGQPLVSVPNAVIQSERTPTASDKAPIGQIWVNTAANVAYILVSISNNQAIWGTYAGMVPGNLVVGGTVTAGLGFVALANGITATGNSTFNGNVIINGALTLPGTLYADRFQTTTNPATSVSLYDDGLWSVGTNADVNITIHPKGNGELIFDGIPVGFLLSEWHELQRSLQTFDAVPTNILSIPISSGEMVSVKALINGFKANFLDCVGGEIMVTAYRPAGGNVELVGAPIINVNYTSLVDTSDIDAETDIGTQSLNIKVIGVAATTYNWVTCSYYMYTIDNN